MLSILGVIISGAGFYYGRSIVHVANEREQKLLSSIVSSDKLEEKSANTNVSTDTFLVHHQCNQANYGIFDLYNQTIYKEIKSIPYKSLSLELDKNENSVIEPRFKVNEGVAVTTKDKIGFAQTPFKTIFTSETFGSNNISQKPDFTDLIDRTHISPNEVISTGSTIQNEISQKCKIDGRLSNDKIYKSHFFPLNGKTVYFSGNKYGEQYVYHVIGTDPKKIAHHETSDQRGDGQILQTFGVAGMIGCALLGIIFCVGDNKHK